MTDQNLPASGGDPNLPEYGAYRPQGSRDEGEFAASGQAQPQDVPQGYASPSPTSGAPYHPYGKPQDGAPSYGQPGAQQSPYGAPQQPYGTPYSNLPPQGGPGGPAGYQQPPKLPGRGWPVTLTILGAVMAFLIAPLVFVGTVATHAASNFADRDLAGLANMTQDGGGVGHVQKFDADESAIIAVKPRDVNWTCTLTHTDGTKVVAKSFEDSGVPQREDAFVAQAKIAKAGSYTTSCVGPNNQQPSELAVIPGALVSDLVRSTVPALLWSTVIGFIGLVVMIVGIVWLVKRNRARKRIMRSYTLY